MLLLAVRRAQSLHERLELRRRDARGAVGDSVKRFPRVPALLLLFLFVAVAATYVLY